MNNIKRESREKPHFNVLERISTLRIERQWTEYELSQRSAISQSTISGWYRRELTPTLPMIEKICTAFGITLSQFFMNSENEDSFSEEQAAIKSAWCKMTNPQRKATIELLNSFINNTH